MISMAEFLTFVHEDDYGRIGNLVNQSVRDGLSMRAEFRIIRTDGSVRYILGIGDPVGVGSEVNEYYGIITDITSQRAAEDAMRVAQADLARVSRATTVGQLTSSIAHEINQPLMSIVSNAGASLRWLNRDPARLDKVREGLEDRRRGRAGGDHPQHSVSDAQTGPHVYANRSALPDPPHHYALPQRT